MNITVLQKDLLRALSVASRAIAVHSTMPVLEGVRLRAKDDELQIYATDLKISIFVKTPAEVRTPGEVILNANLILSIVKKLPDEPIHFDINGSTVKMQTAYSDFTLVAIEDGEYPELTEEEISTVFHVGADTLRDGIAKTLFATGTELTRPVLTGVNFHRKGSTLDFAALDGYRIAVRTSELSSHEEGESIVPAKALTELARILPEEGDVEIGVTKSSIAFSFDGVRMYTRLIEGTFIRYESVLESETTTASIVTRTELAMALERASLLAREERSNLVKLQITQDAIHLTSNTALGQAKECVRAETTGEDLVIAFNARYLLEGLRALDGDRIKLSFSGSLRPLIMRDDKKDPCFTYVVLPVKLAE